MECICTLIYESGSDLPYNAQDDVENTEEYPTKKN